MIISPRPVWTNHRGLNGPCRIPAIGEMAYEWLYGHRIKFCMKTWRGSRVVLTRKFMHGYLFVDSCEISSLLLAFQGVLHPPSSEENKQASTFPIGVHCLVQMKPPRAKHWQFAVKAENGLCSDSLKLGT
jgi:hypothetical protein